MGKPIIASAGNGGGSIPPHPEGQYAATCIDVIDMGNVEMHWQGQTRIKHRIVLRFYCGENFEDSEGREAPLWVDKWFTLSLHENSALRPFLETWRGKKFTTDELKGFDVAKLYKAPALIQVSHNQTADKTYANIDACLKLAKGMDAPGIPNGYVRVEDRPPKDEQQPAGVGGGSGGRYADDDDLPFAPLPSWL